MTTEQPANTPVISGEGSCGDGAPTKHGSRDCKLVIVWSGGELR